MDAGDAQTYFKPKRERNVRRFFWWSNDAGPQPKLSVACLRCFTAFLHKGEDACFLVGRDLVLGNMACDSCAVVIAVALDVPPCTHFYFSFPVRPVLWELFTENVLPGFACCQLKIFVLCQILDKVAVSVLATMFFLVAAISFAFIYCGGMIGFLFIG
jgi:hypothetical protein